MDIGQGGGMTQPSDSGRAETLERVVSRGRQSMEGEEGSSPALHLKTVSNPASGFSDKE